MLVKSHNVVELYCYSLPSVYRMRGCGQLERDTELYNTA
jgi:hypothetical protein